MANKVISTPELAQASGTRFSPAISDSYVEVRSGESNSQFWANLIPEAAKAYKAFADREQDMAFIQGQADHTAGMITEQSWLTERAYQQGVSFQKYTDELAEFPTRMKNVAQESIAKNETLQQYTERVKPFLAQMNSRINDLGLYGDAKDAAAKQIMTSMVSAQKAYQTELEQETFRRVDVGNSKINATAISSILNTSDTREVTDHLTAAWDNTYETSRYAYPKQANDMASKNVLGAVKVAIGNLNPANSQDVQRLRAIEGYFRSSEASRLTPDIRAQGIEAVNAKFMETRATQQVYDEERIREVENRVANGQPVDFKELDMMHDNWLGSLATGEKTPAQVNPLLERLAGIRNKADKDLGWNNFALTAQPIDRMREQLSDPEQTKVILSNTSKFYPNDPTRLSISVMNQGMLVKNMDTIQAGAKVATDMFLPALKMTGNELKEANDGTQGKAFSGFVSRYREAGNKNSWGMQDALLQAIPTEDRPAFEAYMRGLPDGVTPDLRTASARINVIKQQLKEFEASGGINRLTFEPEFFKSKLFGGSADVAGAELTHQPNDQVLALYSQKAEATVKANSSMLSLKGYVVHDADSAMQALIRENLVLRTPSGPVFINPDWAKSVGVQSGVASNNEQLVQTIRQYQVNYASQFGGRVKPDNVYAEVRGTQLVLRAYDKNGTPMYLKNQAGHTVVERTIDAYQVKAQLNADITKQAQELGKGVTLGIARAGNTDFNITKDWGVPFKSNELGLAIGQHLAHVEGYVGKPTATDPRYTQDKVIGIGVNLNAHPAWAAQFQQVQGNPQKLAEMTGKFVKQHYKNWGEWISSAGLPSADQPNSTRYRSQYIALADAAWHGGDGGGQSYARILNTAKTDKAAALTALHKTAYYKQSQKYRRSVLEQGINGL